MTLKIAAVNGKGGAGKTTAVLLLAGEFALQGKRVLIVDVDPGKNIALWWHHAEVKDNLPANISTLSGASPLTLQHALRAANDYDVALFDTPGIDTILVSTLMKEMDLVITPVQPTQKEIEGAAWGVTIATDASDDRGRKIPVLMLRTRIAMTGRSTKAYRDIPQWVAGMQANDYDCHLLETELTERTPYKELYNGVGTIQMMELSEPVKKARLEVMALLKEIMVWAEKTKENVYG